MPDIAQGTGGIDTIMHQQILNQWVKTNNKSMQTNKIKQTNKQKTDTISGSIKSYDGKKTG